VAETFAILLKLSSIILALFTLYLFPTPSLTTSLASKVNSLRARRVVVDFLKKKYIYWLEGLSLCKSVGKGVVSMEKLRLPVQV
jgi:hypothetical protein